MDSEAQILLDDTRAFCERDGRDQRLVNMLAQCRAIDLTESSLVIAAPSRFAVAYLDKQRAVIEPYLEEIAFAQLALEVRPPEQEGGAAPRVQAGPSTPAPTPAPAPAPQTASAAQRAENSAPAPSAPAAAPNTPASQAPAASAEPAPAAAAGSAVRNAVSPADFARLMAQMNGAAAPNTAAAGNEAAGSAPAEPAAEPAAAVGINSKFTFTNFILGSENKLAYQSAIRFTALAEEGAGARALFIYGHSGLGKTHLLLAIKNELAKCRPDLRVKYANSQAYIDDYMRDLADLKNDSGKGVLREYHDADVLIIDDIQNILGKQSTIEQFFQLVDEFIRKGKGIAIASDRAPKELAMDERLTSRFNSGMLCLVSEPGYETKLAILKHYYENMIKAKDISQYANVDPDLLQALQMDSGTLTEDQLSFMAEISGNNIRELESFCERCANDAREKELAGKELTNEDIQSIANQYFDTAAKVIRVGTVQTVVEEFYQVPHKEMIGRKRTSNIATARHMAIYLTYELCSMSLNAIGAAFGGRDHSTVLSSVKVIERRLEGDPSVREECQHLRTKIQLRS